LSKALKTIFKIGLLLAALSLVGRAQESRIYREGDTWVESLTGNLPSANTLKVITDMGSVRIEGTSDNQISYVVTKRVRAYSEQEARRMFEGVSISAGSEDDVAWLKGQAHGSFHSFSSDFSVRVPKSVALVNARTGGGALNVENIDGRLEAETGGGNMHLDNIGRAIDVTTGGGNVDLGRAGTAVRIETGGGNIHIGSVGGALQARSGGGHIEVDSGQGAMELKTGGGSIHVGTCRGSIQAETGGDNIIIGDVSGGAELETGGGSIHLNSAGGTVRAETGGGSLDLHGLARGVEAETGAGSIVAEFTGGGREFTDSKLETAAGDIRVYLPASLPVTVYASIDIADGHSIHSDFSDLKVISEGSEWGPKESYCKGQLNGGGPSLHVHTTTGNIDFLRGSASARSGH
jgi:DUF4097 and DUF4098 domain-containing protein YvlB